MLNVPSSELVLLLLAIAGGGLLTGLLAGLFGVGGGAVIVPVLYEVFRIIAVPETIRMQMCIGTSLAIIVPTTIRSYRTHRAKGAVMEEIVRSWRIPSLVGVAVGAAIAAIAPASVFKAAFAVIAGVIAVRLLVNRDSWRLGSELPRGALMSGYGFIVGLCSSLMGVSGGSVANMILSLYGRPIHQSVATAAGLGVPIAMAGTVGFMLAGLPHQASVPPLSVGFVSLIGVALMAPLSSWIAGHGARLAHAMTRRRLEVAFGLFLMATSFRFAVGLF